MHFLGGQTGDRVIGHTHFEFGEFEWFGLDINIRCVLNMNEIDNEKSWMGEAGCKGSRIYSGSHVSNGIDGSHCFGYSWSWSRQVWLFSFIFFSAFNLYFSFSFSIFVCWNVCAFQVYKDGDCSWYCRRWAVSLSFFPPNCVFSQKNCCFYTSVL